MNVEQMDGTTLKIMAFVDETATYRFYDDDGVTHNHRQGHYTEIHLTITHKAGDFKVKVSTSPNPKVEKLQLVMVNSEGKVQEQAYNLSER